MQVNFKPEVWEIQEMLDCVALTHNLDEILPVAEGVNRAEFMARGWCFLWYENEDKNFLPLGYTFFQFTAKGDYNPYFHFASTQFATVAHVRTAARKIKKLMATELKNRVRVYISDERIAKFALQNGFVKTGNKLSDKDKNGRRRWIQFRKSGKDSQLDDV